MAVKVITRAVIDGQFIGHSGEEDEGDRGDFESMSHEIRILSRLSHPNVVRCYGGCLRPPRVFVVQGKEGPMERSRTHSVTQRHIPPFTTRQGIWVPRISIPHGRRIR